MFYTLCHTIPTFDHPKKKAFETLSGLGKNAHIFNFRVAFTLSSVNVFSSEKSKISLKSGW